MEDCLSQREQNNSEMVFNVNLDNKEGLISGFSIDKSSEKSSINDNVPCNVSLIDVPQKLPRKKKRGRPRSAKISPTLPDTKRRQEPLGKKGKIEDCNGSQNEVDKERGGATESGMSSPNGKVSFIRDELQGTSTPLGRGKRGRKPKCYDSSEFEIPLIRRRNRDLDGYQTQGKKKDCRQNSGDIRGDQNLDSDNMRVSKDSFYVELNTSENCSNSTDGKNSTFNRCESPITVCPSRSLVPEPTNAKKISNTQEISDLEDRGKEKVENILVEPELVVSKVPEDAKGLEGTTDEISKTNDPVKVGRKRGRKPKSFYFNFSKGLDDSSSYEPPEKRRGRPPGRLTPNQWQMLDEVKWSNVEPAEILESTPDISTIIAEEETVSTPSKSPPKVPQSSPTNHQSPRKKGPKEDLDCRINPLTKLKNPKLMVKCAICGKEMTALEYKSKHLLVHNFMCWLEGEPPMPLNDMSIMTIVLNRGKRSFPKFIFKCEKCDLTKKSAKGFFSHVQMCGKSEQERQDLLVSCSVCGRMMLPISLEVHMYTVHRSQDAREPALPHEDLSFKKRKAASACLDKMINLTDADEDDECKEGLRCDECTFTTTSRKNLVNHLRVNHAEYKQEDKLRSESAPSTTIRNTEERLSNRVRMRDALRWTNEWRKQNLSSERVFQELAMKADGECQPLTQEEATLYMPPIKESCRLKLEGSNWQTLPTFNSVVTDESQVMACGGPVWGLGWRPRLEEDDDEAEVIAVSAHTSTHRLHSLVSTYSYKALLQLWSCGNLRNMREIGRMEAGQLLYCLALGCGGAWAIEWCPAPRAAGPSSLGLVALAATSGCIPVFALPKPNLLPETSAEYPFYKLEPVVTLHLGASERAQCTRVTWSKFKPHNIVVGGFANGLVAIWDLNTTSTLLKGDKTLYPFRTFQAHSSIITGVILASQCSLVTTSLDKEMKRWSLSDITSPLCCQRRSSVTDSAYLIHATSLIATFDETTATGNTTMVASAMKHSGALPTPLISTINSAGQSVSTNDWLNGIAVAYENGQVVTMFGTSSERKKPSRIVCEMALHDFMSKKEENSNELIDCESYEAAIKRYGLVFKTDTDLVRKTIKLRVRDASPLDLYPLTAANRVCWNPNPCSFLHLSVGYQAGLVTVSRLFVMEVTGPRQVLVPKN